MAAAALRVLSAGGRRLLQGGLSSSGSGLVRLAHAEASAVATAVREHVPVHPFAEQLSSGQYVPEDALIARVDNPSELTEEHIGRYYSVSREKVFRESLPWEVEAEWAFTGDTRLLARKHTLRLFRHVDKLRSRTSSPRGVLLDGPPCSGKSTTLAALVHWARSSGWLVLYVPSAFAWTQKSSFYSKHASGSWDSSDAAQGVLRRGVEDAQVATDVVLHLREELARVTDAPVLIAIDEYNALYLPTAFGETTGHRSRRIIHASEFRMFDAYRCLNRLQLANGVVAAATTGTGVHYQVGDNLPDTSSARFPVQRYTLAESAAALAYYSSCEALDGELDVKKVAWLHHLTAGNGKELRLMAAQL
eukprot:jgi/Chlat1/4046/Chrsp26S04098